MNSLLLRLRAHPHTLGLVLLILSLALGFALRMTLVPHVSGDMRVFLIPWLQRFRELGLVGALGESFANYNPTYLYLLGAASLLPDSVSEAFAIKITSLLADLSIAYLVLRLVALRYRSPLVQALAFSLSLFLPTVFLNSAMWGQCDAVHTAFLLACVYFLVQSRGLLACLSFSVALSIKLQAAFLAPLIVIALLRGVVNLRQLLMIPLIYLSLLAPAALAGRPVDELLTIYWQQADFYRNLAPNISNLYFWFSDGDVFKQQADTLYPLLVPFGLTLGLSFAIGLTIFASLARRQPDPSFWVWAAYILSLGMPYVLPKMHDRYYYAADILSLVVVFLHPRLWWLALCQQLVSLSGYTNVLGFSPLIEHRYSAILGGVLLVFGLVQAGRLFYCTAQVAPPASWAIPLLSWPKFAYSGVLVGLLIILTAATWQKVEVDRPSLALPISGGEQSGGLLPVERVMWSWRPSRGGRDLFDSPLTSGGKSYAHGFAVHAPSKLIYHLPANATLFEASIGIPDYLQAGAPTTLVFEIYGDRALLWRSAPMGARAEVQSIRIPVTGVTRLILAVTDAGDGDFGDHALWLDPRVTPGETTKSLSN